MMSGSECFTNVVTKVSNTTNKRLSIDLKNVKRTYALFEVHHEALIIED